MRTYKFFNTLEDFPSYYIAELVVIVADVVAVAVVVIAVVEVCCVTFEKE